MTQPHSHKAAAPRVYGVNWHHEEDAHDAKLEERALPRLDVRVDQQQRRRDAQRGAPASANMSGRCVARRRTRRGWAFAGGNSTASHEIDQLSPGTKAPESAEWASSETGSGGASALTGGRAGWR